MSFDDPLSSTAIWDDVESLNSRKNSVLSPTESSSSKKEDNGHDHVDGNVEQVVETVVKEAEKLSISQDLVEDNDEITKDDGPDPLTSNSVRRPSTTGLNRSLSHLQELDLESSPLGPLNPVSRTASPDLHPISVKNDAEPEAKYIFDINVTEPFQIGDKISGHVEYRIKTRTDSPKYKAQEFSVARRFRDFVWIYTQLVNSYPGLIIPPVPEKLTIGRFQDEFIEARRIALEKFCKKCANHPLLQNDEDFQLFIESTNFSSDIKSRDTTTEIIPFVNQPFPKIPDNDKTLESHRLEFEILDGQLKNLLKSIKALMKQRKDLCPISLELGDSMIMLSNSEKNLQVAEKLRKLGNIHKAIRTIQERQAMDDMSGIAATVEDHIRTIGSVKVAYNCRLKAYTNLNAQEASLTKRKDMLEKLQQSSKLRTDKIASMQADIRECEIDIETISRDFQLITQRLLNDLKRYELEKIKSFTDSLREFLEKMLASQREILELWKSYYSETQ